MPGDRAADSYAVYSELLVNGPVEWRDAKRNQWLVEDETMALPLTAPCVPPESDGRFDSMMNPHKAIEAPVNRQQDWQHVLDDYDRHCHDVLQLSQSRFTTRLPVHLMNAAEIASLRANVLNPPAPLANGAGLHSFTEVFFNPAHTIALVEQGMWCGGLCGEWTWVVLERDEGIWKQRHWVRTNTMS